MANNFCPNCGERLEAGANFCNNCGQALSAPAEAREQQPMAQQLDRGYGQQVPYGGSAPQQPRYYEYGPEDLQPHGSWIKRNFFSYEGRMNRQKYLINSLILCALDLLVIMAVLLIFYICFESELTTMDEDELMLLIVAVTICIFIPCLPMIVSSYLIGIQRCHDFDKPGWLMLIPFVPYVGGFFYFVLLFLKGTDGPNQYGPDPLQNPQLLS